MPRTARASVGGICYRVLNRGNGRAEVFHKDGDYASFLQLMAEANERLPLRILEYALLPNHLTSPTASARRVSGTAWTAA